MGSGRKGSDAQTAAPCAWLRAAPGRAAAAAERALAWPVGGGGGVPRPPTGSPGAPGFPPLPSLPSAPCKRNSDRLSGQRRPEGGEDNSTFPRGRQGRVSADTVALLSQIFPRAGVLAWTPDPQCPALRRKATNYNSFSVIAADPQQALLDVCGTSRLGRQGLAAGPGPGAAAGDDGAEWPAGRHDAQPPEHGRGGENGRVAGRPRTSYTSCHDIEPLRPPRLSPPAASCLLLQKGRCSLVPIKKVILSPGVSEDGKDRPAG